MLGPGANPGNNAHDYKFSSAILEDYYHVSSAWRDKYMASDLFMLRFMLHGSGRPDDELVGRVADAEGNLRELREWFAGSGGTDN